MSQNRAAVHALVAGVPFRWVAADSVYGVGDIERDLRQAGKGYVLGVNSSHWFASWGEPQRVVGTAEELAKLPALNWATIYWRRRLAFLLGATRESVSSLGATCPFRDVAGVRGVSRLVQANSQPVNGRLCRQPALPTSPQLGDDALAASAGFSSRRDPRERLVFSAVTSPARQSEAAMIARSYHQRAIF